MPVNSSVSPLFYYCLDSQPAVNMFIGFLGSKLLLCGPLSILVLYLGHKQWKCSTKPMSHSDVLTHHMAAVELNVLIANVFYLFGTYTDFRIMAKIGFLVQNIAFPGEMWFHCLTCVERYLAVVHPIMYRGMRQSKGIRIRNISIGCAWLQCVEWLVITTYYAPEFPIIHFFCLLTASLIVVTFCSLSVLQVLIRPGPGDVGGDEKQVDKFKQRAFDTVVAILAVLWLWFVGILVCMALGLSQLLSYTDRCVVTMVGICCSLPSSVVLHVLYLQRAEKLPCCHCNNSR